MKLKEVLFYIKTYDRIRIKTSCKEDVYTIYGEIIKYQDYWV